MNNNQEEAKRLDNEWYKNADLIAQALKNINPHYCIEALRSMLYKHLDLIKEEVTYRVQGDYKKEIDKFDEVEKEGIMMADYFAQ